MSNEEIAQLFAPVATAAQHDPLLALTALISASFVSANKVPPDKVPPLITGIHQTLAALAQNGHAGNGHASNGAAAQTLPLPRGVRGAVPAIDVRKSVFADHLVCIECARKMKTLKRHLAELHSLTPERYRHKWHLPDTYPMVAPDYAKARSAMAKQMGLGRKGRTRR